jgi:hypothetical protein
MKSALQARGRTSRGLQVIVLAAVIALGGSALALAHGQRHTNGPARTAKRQTSGRARTGRR